MCCSHPLLRLWFEESSKIYFFLCYPSVTQDNLHLAFGNNTSTHIQTPFASTQKVSSTHRQDEVHTPHPRNPRSRPRGLRRTPIQRSPRLRRPSLQILYIQLPIDLLKYTDQRAAILLSLLITRVQRRHWALSNCSPLPRGKLRTWQRTLERTQRQRTQRT